MIADLLDILANASRVTTIITDELTEIKKQFGDKRRSEIVENAQDLSLEDLITPQDVVVTLSHTGYIKSQPLRGIPCAETRRSWQASCCNQRR